MSSHPGPSSARPFDAAELHRRLAPVLADLPFPAARWQALTVSDLYGADSVTRTLLERLPERRYATLGELFGILAAVLAGQYVPERPAAPARPAVRPPRAGASGAGGPRVAPTTRTTGTATPGRPQPAA